MALLRLHDDEGLPLVVPSQGAGEPSPPGPYRPPRPRPSPLESHGGEINPISDPADSITFGSPRRSPSPSSGRIGQSGSQTVNNTTFGGLLLAAVALSIGFAFAVTSLLRFQEESRFLLDQHFYQLELLYNLYEMLLTCGL